MRVIAMGNISSFYGIVMQGIGMMFYCFYKFAILLSPGVLSLLTGLSTIVSIVFFVMKTYYMVKRERKNKN